MVQDKREAIASHRRDIEKWRVGRTAAAKAGQTELAKEIAGQIAKVEDLIAGLER